MIKIGKVYGDVIEAGGVKNVTNNYYGDQPEKEEHDMVVGNDADGEIPSIPRPAQDEQCSGQAEDEDDTLCEIAELLSPIFFNDENEAESFLLRIKNVTPMQVIEEVNTLIAQRKISSMSCNKPLWSILNANGYYPRKLNNWNDKIRK